MIRYFTGHVQGYGAPGYHWIKVVFDNKLLEENRSESSVEFGRVQVLLEQKWNALSLDKLVKAAVKCPEASPTCYHCKEGVIYSGGSTSIGALEGTGSVSFCHKPACEKALEQYHKRLSDHITKRREKMDRSVQRSRKKFEARQKVHTDTTREFLDAFKEDPRSRRFLVAAQRHAKDELDWRGEKS